MLTDLEHERVLEVVPGRDKGAACSLYKTLRAQELEKLQAVAMDMSETFSGGTPEIARKGTRRSDVAFRGFNEVVDQVRKAENKALLAEGDERLKGRR